LGRKGNLLDKGLAAGFEGMNSGNIGGYFLQSRGINKGNQVQGTLKCLAPVF
jgi:hypothetical protein